jgi:hypothetical protein
MRTASLLAGAFCLLGFGSPVFAEGGTSPDAAPSKPAETAPCPAGEQPADKECSATPPATTSEQSKSSRPAGPPAERPQSSSPTSEEVADLTEDPVVCKRVKVTGSHVRKSEVCLKQSEWAAGRDAAKKLMTDAEQRRSPQMRKGPSAP